MISHIGRVTNVARSANDKHRGHLASGPGVRSHATALYTLTRLCLTPAKINYLLRTNELRHTSHHAGLYDRAVLRTLKAILDLDDGDERLSPDSATGCHAVRLAQLRAREGGLGLTAAVSAAGSSRAGSLLLTANIVARFMGDDFNCVEHGLAALPELARFREAYGEGVARGWGRIEALDGTIDELFASQHCGVTKALANFGSASYRDGLLSQLEPQLAAFVRSGGDDGARFLRASFSAPFNQRLTDAEFRTMLLARIGLPSSDTGPRPGTQCAHCTGLNSSLHPLHCQQKGRGGFMGQRSARHAVTKDAIIAAINRVAKGRGKPGFVAPNEPVYSDVWPYKDGVTGTEPRCLVRGDIGTTIPGNGCVRVADLVVTHPNVAAKSLAAASRADGVAAEQGFRNKVTGLDKFFSRLAGARHQFHPISYETGGRLHPESRLYFEQIVKDIIDTPPEAWSKEDMAFYQASLDAILDAASVALAKSVASTLRPGLQAGAQHGDDADTISDLEDDVNDGDATMMQ